MKFAVSLNGPSPANADLERLIADQAQRHAIDDADRLQQDVARARRLGFAGKLCIHPKQVAPVNAGMAPSAAERAWAQRVLAAAAASGGAAVAVDGKMVDKPVLLRAEAILREFNIEELLPRFICD